MARSHVKELLRTAFRWEQVAVDEDGDVPMPCGTAMVYASVVGKGRLVRVWSRAVSGVKVTKSVLREINDANRSAGVARVYAEHSAVWVEGHFPIEGLRVKDLKQLCLAPLPRALPRPEGERRLVAGERLDRRPRRRHGSAAEGCRVAARRRVAARGHGRGGSTHRRAPRGTTPPALAADRQARG